MPPQLSAEQRCLVSTLWSTAALVAGGLLHADRIPPWATGILLACAVGQVGVAAGRLPALPKIAQLLLTFLLVACVVVTFHTLNGLAAGSVLLVVMGSVKLLETRSRRDCYIVIGAALFLLLAASLDRQGLVHVPLYVAQAGLCCTALGIAAYGGAGLDVRIAAALALRSLLLALPLALVFFLFFPRLPGGFWSLPAHDEAVTGLGESMSPGSIAQLTTSYDPAFRVRFASRVPAAEERYWRGPVLHDFDGYTWRHGAHQYRQQLLRHLGEPFRYTVTLVPDANRWWIALDTVAGAPDKRALYAYDYDLVAREPVTQPTTYEALSYTRTESSEPLSNYARQVETALPPSRNPRTRELAARLRAQTVTDPQFVRAAIDFFRGGGFQYSLTPQKLDYDSVDDFLFRTREGFCGHFASAFVALLRAGGVPARVVTGYQGGEWNPIGEYFLVRQSDAHAWAEVWIDGRGWRRLDPTALVAPERLRRGTLDLWPGAGSQSARLLRTTPLFARLLQGWDALNTAWNERIVKFDVTTQFGILERLGVHSADWTALIAALASGFVAWLGWIAWHIGRAAGARPRDPLARAYASLCRKLARAGVAREIYEGPLAYGARIARCRPDLARQSQRLLRRYAHLRYAPLRGRDASAAIVRFERMVARWHAARRS